MAREALNAFYRAKDVLVRNKNSWVQHHERGMEKVIGLSNMAGDIFLQFTTAIQSGFLQTLSQGTPDHISLRHAYLSRPLPLVSSGLFLYGSSLVANHHFAKGSFVAALGSCALLADAFLNKEYITAATVLPALAGNFINAAHESLERNFGHHPNLLLRTSLGTPKRTGGLLLAAGCAPFAISAAVDRNWAYHVAGDLWTGAALLSSGLPEKNAPPAPVKPLKFDALKPV